MRKASTRSSRAPAQSSVTPLRKEVAKGHIAGPYSEPPLPGFKVVPRGLKEEPTKFRPISQPAMPSKTAKEALDWWAKALDTMKQGEQQWQAKT